MTTTTTDLLDALTDEGPRTGQIKVVFANAITERRTDITRYFYEIADARVYADNFHPYNNTRVRAYRILTVDAAILTVEIDLATGEPTR